MSNSSVEGDYDAYSAAHGAAFVANLPALRKALMQNPEAPAKITQKLAPSLPKEPVQTIMDQYNPIFEIAHDVKKTI